MSNRKSRIPAHKAILERIGQMLQMKRVDGAKAEADIRFGEMIMLLSNILIPAEQVDFVLIYLDELAQSANYNGDDESHEEIKKLALNIQKG